MRRAVLAPALRASAAIILRVLAASGRTRRAMRMSDTARLRGWAVGSTGSLRRWGTRFTLDLDDAVQRAFYYTGWWERPFLEFLAAELGNGDVYLDVGAHIGIDAAFVAHRCPTVDVLAFEPVPATAASLRRHTAVYRNVRVAEVALGDAERLVEMRAQNGWHPNDAATRSLYASGPVVAET